MKKTNVVGVIALGLAVVGFILACIPVTMLIGWFLLIVGFILSIVSLFLKYKRKRAGIAALVVSVVGTVVGIIVFLSTVATLFDNNFDPDNLDVSPPAPTLSAPATEPADATTAPDAGTGDLPVTGDAADSGASPGAEGSMSNPLPLGSTITQNDWEVTVNSVNLDATQAVLDENMFNEKPADGDVYALVNLTMTYMGDDPDGQFPAPGVSYVTIDGQTRHSFDTFAVAPDGLAGSGALQHGASTTGNVLIVVPAETAAEGTLAVNPGMLGDNTYFAVK